MMSWGFPLKLALIAGILTLALGYACVITVDNYYPATFGEIWDRWDASHYLAIAEGWYSQDPQREHLIGFYPLYPALVALMTVVLRDPVIASLVVSNLAFAAGLVLLKRLSDLDFSTQRGDLALIFCTFFPTAYFFHLGYTESLFLALSVGAFLAARSGRWAWAGVLAACAGATRVPGVVLFPALLVEYLYQRRFQVREIRWNVLFTVFPFLGLGVYLWINWTVTGNPFEFLELQKRLYFREVASPIAGLVNDCEGLFIGRPSTRFVMCGMDLVIFFSTIAVLIWSALKLRPSYTVYAVLIWLLTFCYSFWMSVPRLVLVMFPMYFFLAWLTEKRPSLRYGLIFLCLFGYFLGVLQFARGWWAH